MSVRLPREGRYLLDFDTRELPRFATDVLVIGGGIAGLRAALAASGQGAHVAVLFKDGAGVSNTAWAQGGVAAAVGDDDTAEAHAVDTLRAGCGLCDETVVRTVTTAGPAAVDDLVARGARFDMDAEAVALAREGGHGRRRVLHRGDATGVEISRALFDEVRGDDRVTLHERVFVVDLLTAEGRCVGALGQRRDGALFVFLARSVVLAAGGAGRLYRETSNVRGATGDGIAAAYRAGAVLQDLEFVQFHPTTLYLAGSDRVLVTEAVRGEGAHVVDNLGRRFLFEAHEAGELAPRDVVSRALVRQLARPDVAGVFLDLRHWEQGRAGRQFPGLATTCARYGLDPERDLIPVRPAAHYFIGGVAADVDGRTSMPGLFACGEAACSGLHGANRLASNSLLEGLVLGARAGEAAAREGLDRFDGEIEHRTRRRVPEEALDIDDLRKSMASLLWRSVGIERDGAGLAQAGENLALWRHFSSGVALRRRAAFELENMLLLGALVAAAALRREESRGVHGRSDRPAADDARFLGHIRWRAGAPPEFVRREVPVIG